MHQKAARTEWKSFLGYGTGDYALNLFWQSVGFYLFFFYTDVVGVPPEVVGTIFLIGMIWDAATDPVMGYLAERTTGRWGPYRPYLLFGAIPLGVSFALLFTPIHISDSFWQAAYILVTLLLFRTCYTVVSIPYSALSARVTRASNGRTRLAAIRMYCGFLGGVSITAFAKWLQQSKTDEVAFSLMGYSAAVVGIIVLIICFISTRNTLQEDLPDRHPSAMRESLAAILKNGPFLLLVGGIMLVTVATTIIGQSVLYFFESQVGDRGPGTTAIFIMSGAGLICIPFWAYVALKIGKRNAWLTGSVIASAGLALLYGGFGDNSVTALASMMVVTLGLSSFAVIFWSMLPDTIEYGEFKSMVQNESLLIGVASSFQKISIGLSAFALGLLLKYVGYQADAPLGAATADGIRHIFTVIPFVALMVSGLLIFFYPITAKLHGEIISALKARNST
ncbi:MFS transporter [Kordiimonas lacus]|uniref:Glycoside/pentoside/hexuronide:cation symporter, GPH family n=1 Tax=Kordiimonas lacus TaxID=637679 RepID=A0A1G7DAZ2_9PROT|nr:MFS transporter [Kordiimonas lacus]SDE47905.1 glycoside/pentoside/hexuronide:cation symporter, GPH family [Kordiimonas lacus]